MKTKTSRNMEGDGRWCVRKFGSEVIVRWLPGRTREDVVEGYRIQIFLREVTPEGLLVDTCVHGARRNVPFSVKHTYNADQFIRGIIHYREGVHGLDIENFCYPSGKDEQAVLEPRDDWRPECSLPSAPEDGRDSGVDEVFIGPAYADLFPYIHMRLWPNVGQQDPGRRFVSYKSTPGAQTLYSNLVARKEKKDHAGMVADALQFLNNEEPYQGQVIQSLNELMEPLCSYPRLDERMRESRGHDFVLAEFLERLQKHIPLEWRQDIKTFVLTDGRYLAQIDQVWQNIFARIVIPVYQIPVHQISGYQTELLDRMIQVVVLSQLVSQVVQEDIAGEDKLAHEVRERASASIILPADAFPLPPAQVSVVDTPPVISPVPKDEVQPYAIGDLQMVRHRLVRYEMGEVAHIENVLRGEEKQTTQRKLSREEESTTSGTAGTQETGNQSTGVTADLFTEAWKTIEDTKAATTFCDLTTSYGAPSAASAKISGSWSVENQPLQPGWEESTKYAKDITTKTVNRIARQVSQARKRSTLAETEETVVHRFDNTRGEANVRGIYRWLNKVYRAQVVNHGSRLSGGIHRARSGIKLY